MKRRLLASVLSGVIAAGALSACAAGTAAPAESGSAPAVEMEAAAPAEEAGAAEETAAEAYDGEITEINVFLAALRDESAGVKEVEAAMNEITEKTIGVHANIEMLSIGDYVTQLGLMFTGSDIADVIGVTARPSVNMSSLISNNQVLDITDLMQEEGAETLEMMGEYINACTSGGRIYGIPCWRNYADSVYLTMRKDILDQLGMEEKARAMTSWSDYEEILQAVADNTDLAPIASGMRNVINKTGSIFAADAFEEAISYDALGDTMSLIFSDTEGNISLLPAMDEFRAQQDKVRKWYNTGYIYKDSTTSDEDMETYIKNGVAFSGVTSSELGVEAFQNSHCGTEMVVVEVKKNLIGSAAVNRFGLAVPARAAEPEAAVRWINALYTDPALENLLIWGIEGRDYEVVDGVARYPEGVTEETALYHSHDFMEGNFFNAYPWEGSGDANFRQVAYDYLMSATPSPFLGFSVDMSEEANIIAQLSTVTDKYKADLFCGRYEDDIWDKYMSELEVAGINEYLDAYQTQLTAWKAEQ